MIKFTKISFRVRDKGGKLAKQVLERQVPDFDWSEFKNLPNAEAFARKFYFASVKRIMRELEEDKSQTTGNDLRSMEAVLTRSVRYTKDEMIEWVESRSWDLCNFPDKVKALQQIEKWLTELAIGDLRVSRILCKRVCG